jgi:cytochrome oxidase assembly protein ShyY1
VSWRFALRPKWIVRHVAVVVLVVVMVLLGFWQLRRLDEKRDHKALVEARQEAPIEDVLDVVPVGAEVGDAAVEGVLYRSVRAEGSYVDEDTVVVENRTLNGASGAWVLTPLRLADGLAVLVNRGFIGFDRSGAIDPPAAPAGAVTVEGLVFPSQERGRFGPQDPDEGDLPVLARVDLDRLEAQVDYEVLPAYVQLVESEPGEDPVAAGAPSVVPLGPPEPEEGPHLSYAMQWFIFSTIAGGGYVLLLRRVARDQAKEETGAVADAELAVSLDRGR